MLHNFKVDTSESTWEGSFSKNNQILDFLVLHLLVFDFKAFAGFETLTFRLELDESEEEVEANPLACLDERIIR